VALIARYLIDTSAAVRLRHPEVSRRLRPLIEGGAVATTASLDAEGLYSACGPAEYEQLWADRRAAYEYLSANDEHCQTALGAQRPSHEPAASSRRHGRPAHRGPRRRTPTHRCALLR
jgi:predicted nucleic acid-binding protein